MKSGDVDSKERQEKISVERTERAIAATDDVELKGLLAIARYCGLRVPSEIQDLKFSDFEIVSPGMIFAVPRTGKTRTRKVPLFTNFLPHYNCCFPVGKRSRNTCLKNIGITGI